MTDQSSYPVPERPRRPLPVTVVPGMPVVDIVDGTVGSITGITQAYCIHRLTRTNRLQVANWRDMALGNICPAEPLLPDDVAENDRRNARATLLRELLALEQVGPLTAHQKIVYDELLSDLCGP